MIKIPTAYCFETDTITPADLAVNKRDLLKQEHHYFCVSRNCAHPMDAAHRQETGVAWFRSKPKSMTSDHVLTCPYREEQGAGNKSVSEVRYQKNPFGTFVVPTVLGSRPATPARVWMGNAPPTREQLAFWASKAKHEEIYGDLEDVVNAYETIRTEKSKFPLNIGGRVGTYQKAFPWIWSLPIPPNNQDWNNQIVRSYCAVTAGKIKGFWFLKAYSPVQIEPPMNISLMVRYEDIARDTKKRPVEELLRNAAASKGRIQLFWLGSAPELSERGRVLDYGNRPPHTYFALRPIPTSEPRPK